MSKKGISQIKGPSEIRLGETAYYEVSRIYDLDDKKKVDAARWKLYALDFKHQGNWRELTPKAGTPPKIGYRVPVIVTNQSLVGSELMLEAFIYEPEKRIPPGLRIKVLPGIEKKITRMDLFKVDDTPIKDDTVMKYGQTIKVKVYTQNMQNEMMKLSLYEDDAQGGGDSPKNKNNRVAYIKKPLNKKGFLVHEFKLNIDFAKIANAIMDGSHDKLHEYYVVAETAEHKSVSKNVDVQNPDYVKVQTVSSGVDTKKTYGETLIEPVTITVKVEKKVGNNPNVDTGNQIVTVAKPDEKKVENKCACQQYDLIWGDKVSCEFRKKVVEICNDLWGEENKIKMANYLMAIFQWESGGTFKPDAPNQANSGGTGLIQFMPSTAKGLLGKEVTVETVKNYYGKKYNKKTKQKEDWNLKRVKEFANMTAVKQLDYVKEFFKDLKGKNIEFIDVYLKVLFPASSGLSEHVVFADSSSKLDRTFENDKLKNKRVAAYPGNKGLDINGDGKIMKSEIKLKVQPYITEGLSHRKIEKCENKNDEDKKSTVVGACTDGKVVDGFIVNSLVTKNKINSCNKNSMPKEVEIVVLHRTAGGKASGTLTHMSKEGYGAHFVIDYDGTVYQTIGLDKKGSHMGVKQYPSTIKAGWGNGNSIAIETCGYSMDKDGNKRVGPKYDKIPHDHWEPVTDSQAKSVACLLKFLLNHFNLKIDDVKVHEKLCQKEPKEGADVYNAMLTYFNKNDEK